MTRRFRFGIQLSEAGSRAEWAAAARRAEAAGFDVLTVPDHVGRQLSPFAALVAAAEATDRIRLGTFVLDNDFRHPLLTAHEAATVQVLTEGRFELGIGAGWLGRDYERLGIEFAAPRVRFERLREAVEILELYFRGDRFSFRGRHYRIEDAEPIAIPGGAPPLVIGGGGPRMLSLAGEQADVASVFLTSLPDGSGFDETGARPEAYEKKVSTVRAAGAGRAVELNVLLQHVEVTEDRAGIAEKTAPEWGVDARAYPALPFVLLGTPAQMADDLLERRDRYGISYVTVFDKDAEHLAPVIGLLAGR
ncbi:MAG: TIGR03621 family F420-dependent LLM class oxidoreductase [Actinomycetota bacterium]|nr:TIGR03621 family F420-dependent LLM class oxidoreductase [Actinomycetota bacterium]